MCIKPIEIINQTTGENITIECGKCIQCRAKKCRTWALKLYHESKYHSKMCMVTLTFKPSFLFRYRKKKLIKYIERRKHGEVTPERIKIEYYTHINPSYITNVKKTGWLLTLFNKKLRKHFEKDGKYITFFAVGEHGSQNTHRAHWHVIYFGIDKNDLKAVLIGKSKKQKEIYYSKIIENYWNYDNMNIGHHTISDVTTATMKYVANYTMKKMYKNKEKNEKFPTIMRFSNRKKIGLKWARRNHKELRKEFLTDNDGKKYTIPKAYYKEMLRFENDWDNYNYNNTACIIEYNKDIFINRMAHAGLLKEEEMRKKAYLMEKRYAKTDRDTF